MFNIFGRRRREEKPTPPWLVWLAILFLFYAMVSNRQPGSDVQRSVEKAKENIEQQQLFDVSGFTNKLFPEGKTGLQVKDNVVGSGSLALCGQSLSLAFSAELADGSVLKESASKDAPRVLSLADDNIAPAFVHGAAGMAVGGTRQVIAPLSLTGFDSAQKEGLNPTTPVRLSLELLGVEPDVTPAEKTPFRILPVTPGRGTPIRCGAPARLHVSLWSLSGEKLFDSKDTQQPVTFTPGKSEVFLGLEQGAIGLRPGATAVFIVPPVFQKHMRPGSANQPFPLPKNETILVEVEAL